MHNDDHTCLPGDVRTRGLSIYHMVEQLPRHSANVNHGISCVILVIWISDEKPCLWALVIPGSVATTCKRECAESTRY